MICFFSGPIGRATVKSIATSACFEGNVVILAELRRQSPREFKQWAVSDGLPFLCAGPDNPHKLNTALFLLFNDAGKKACVADARRQALREGGYASTFLRLVQPIFVTEPLREKRKQHLWQQHYELPVTPSLNAFQKSRGNDSREPFATCVMVASAVSAALGQGNLRTAKMLLNGLVTQDTKRVEANSEESWMRYSETLLAQSQDVSSCVDLVENITETLLLPAWGLTHPERARGLSSEDTNKLLVGLKNLAADFIASEKSSGHILTCTSRCRRSARAQLPPVGAQKETTSISPDRSPLWLARKGHARRLGASVVSIPPGPVLRVRASGG